MSILTLSVLSITSCVTSESSAPWTGTTDTLPGGGIIVSNSGSGIWDSSSAWELEEDLLLGAVSGEEHDSFADIRYIGVDVRDLIYILDRQAQEIRVFDSAGVYVRTVGRRGNGPGEFANAIGFGFDPRGNLWVSDWQNLRYSVFDSSGVFAKSYPTRDRTLGGSWNGRILNTGALYDVVSETFGEGRRNVLVRFDTSAGYVDSLPLPIHVVDFWRFTGRSGTTGVRYQMNIPFAPWQCWDIDATGHLWLGTSDKMSFSKMTLGADTTLVVERAYDPIPVTDADRERALSRFSALEELNGTADPSDMPAQKPAFRSFMVGDAGHLWVFPSMHFDDTGTLIDIFDSDGMYQGQLKTNETLQLSPSPVVRKGALYAVVLDEMDVPHVVRYRIHGKKSR